MHNHSYKAKNDSHQKNPNAVSPTTPPSPQKTMPTLDIPQESLIHLDFLNELLGRIEHLGIFTHNLSAFVLEVIALDSTSMRELNLAHRGKDSTTDVLSFPLCYDMYGEIWGADEAEMQGKKVENKHLDMDSSPLDMPLGSIVINYELASQVAKKLGHSTQEEMSLLFIHGFLHILGYDHERDNGEQRAIEQKIIESLGLGKSLIVRAEQ